MDDYYNQKVERGISRATPRRPTSSAPASATLWTQRVRFPATLRHPRAPLPRPYGRALLRNAAPTRDYNISKRPEFVLARESVAYGDYASLEDDLEKPPSRSSARSRAGRLHRLHRLGSRLHRAHLADSPLRRRIRAPSPCSSSSCCTSTQIPKTAAGPSRSLVAAVPQRALVRANYYATFRSESSPIRPSCASS